jgi:hypothetical protein
MWEHDANSSTKMLETLPKDASARCWMVLEPQPAIITSAVENVLGVDLKAQKHRDLSAFNRVVELPVARLDEERFKLLQKWEGKVLVADDQSFIAELRSLTDLQPNEEVEIALEEVPMDDRDMVKVGATFYWSIGYLIKPHGQQIRASEIRFRRIPGWTVDEIERASSRAETLTRFLNQDCA